MAAAPFASIKRNLGWLLGLQAATVLLPLITVPMLVRSLGHDGFGSFSYVTAVMALLMTLVDYGSSLHLTKLIATHRDDALALSRTFFAILSSKLILVAAAFLLLTLAIPLLPSVGVTASLYYLGFLQVVGAALTPTWYFLGREELFPLTATTVAIRLLGAVGIWIAVASPAHLRSAVAINAGSNLLLGVTTFFIAWRRLPRPRLSTPLTAGLRELRNGAPLFVTSVGVSLYTNLTTLVLGYTVGGAMVGRYSAADRIVKACQLVLSSAGQAAFPRVTRLGAENPRTAKATLRRLLAAQAGVALLLALGLFVMARVAVRILYGRQQDEIVMVLRSLSPVLFLGGVSTMLTMAVLIPRGYYRRLSNVVLVSGAVNLPVLYLASRSIGLAGACLSVVFVETLILTLMYLAVRREI